MLQIGLFVVAGLCALGALLFLGRSLVARIGMKKRAYGVERQDARQEMLVYAFTSAGLLLLMLVFCGLGTVAWVALGDDSSTAVVEPPLPTAVSTRTEGTEENPTAVSSPTVEGTEETPVAETPAAPTPDTSEPIEPPTPTPLPTATLEPTPAQTTAVVNSPVVGLYLRTGPGGDIVERLEDQSVVILLGNEQTQEEIIWVEVQAQASGNVGWVALDYLIVGDGGSSSSAPALPTLPTEGGVVSPTVPLEGESTDG